MIVFPNAKINIGLNVVSKRPDGYHNLETIFFPVKIFDALEMAESKKTTISFSGIQISGSPDENLVLKAYRLLQEKFDLPPVQFHLHKKVPFGAGLGGGSSDAAFTLKMLNDYFDLNISNIELEKYAAQIGADCPFFIHNIPTFATGIGNQFQEIKLNLEKYQIVVLKPPFHVNTADAYRSIIPEKPKVNLPDLIKSEPENWKDSIVNDFEKTVFSRFPEIQKLKETLYKLGALYASMSGSGSAVFGIFRNLPTNFDDSIPEGIFIYR